MGACELSIGNTKSYRPLSISTGGLHAWREVDLLDFWQPLLLPEPSNPEDRSLEALLQRQDDGPHGCSPAGADVAEPSDVDVPSSLQVVDAPRHVLVPLDDVVPVSPCAGEVGPIVEQPVTPLVGGLVDGVDDGPAASHHEIH